MINWFWRSNRKSPGQDYREMPAQNILERLSDLEKTLLEVKEKLADKYWSIDKVIVEKMHADKVEFNLEKIDVKDLSGMLSIGMNYGGKQIKMEAPSEEKDKKNIEKEPMKNNVSVKTKTSTKYTADSPEPKEDSRDTAEEETVLSTKTGPVIKMRFK